jgi:hypothetical protein
VVKVTIEFDDGTVYELEGILDALQVEKDSNKETVSMKITIPRSVAEESRIRCVNKRTDRVDTSKEDNVLEDGG